MQVLAIFAVTAVIATAAVEASETAAIPSKFRASLEASCGELSEVDRARLPSRIEQTERGFQQQARTARLVPSKDADPVIKILLFQSGPQPSPERTVWAWQEADGQWRVSRAIDPKAEATSVPPVTETKLEPKSESFSDWEVKEGVLSASAARMLEVALASECFEREPAVRPLTVPLRNGGELNCAWHPAGTVIKITKNGNQRTLVRACRQYFGPTGTARIDWPSDLIADLLQREAVQQSQSDCSTGPATEDCIDMSQTHRRLEAGVIE